MLARPGGRCLLVERSQTHLSAARPLPTCQHARAAHTAASACPDSPQHPASLLTAGSGSCRTATHRSNASIITAVGQTASASSCRTCQQRPAAASSSSSSSRYLRRCRTVTHDSSGSSNAAVSTINTTAAKAGQALPGQQQQGQALPGQQGSTTDALSPQQQQQQVAALQEQQQEVRGLKQLVQQQQALIAALQRDMQELKAAVSGQQLQQPASPSSSSSSSSSGVSPGSWRQQAQQAPQPPQQQQLPQQQQQQRQAPSSEGEPGVVHGGYTPMSVETFQSLPDKIILVRHAESLGNVDATTYSSTPDYEVPLSARGWEQAVSCGHSLRSMMEAEHGPQYKLFFMTSPYCRTRQTFVGIRQAFPDENFAGVQEEVQLREQDFGNFQNPSKIQADLAERNRFGRFYYRFPDGESGSDVYNRVSIFEDHLIRDMKASRFSATTSLCLVTHGLTMRVFLMRWFNWTVESFLQVYNPPNATPIIVEKIPEAEFLQQTRRLREKRQTLQVKHAYRLRGISKSALKMNTVATTDNIDLVGHTYHS